MGLDESDVEEAPEEENKENKTSKDEPEVEEEIEKPPKRPPELSSQVMFLLKVLEFNQIDMYRYIYSCR